MRHPIIDKILTEWAYRVPNGMPNPKNPLHIVQLRESMQYLKIDEEVIDIMINKMNEASDKFYARAKDSGRVVVFKNK